MSGKGKEMLVVNLLIILLKTSLFKQLYCILVTCFKLIYTFIN